MPLDLSTLSFLDRPVTKREGIEILKRDQYRCQYCGLDGSANFENALAMSVDFVLARARKGKRVPQNLVACCRSCNLIKGKHVFRSFDEAKRYVLKTREELRKAWETEQKELPAAADTATLAQKSAADAPPPKAKAAAASVLSSSPLSLRKH